MWNIPNILTIARLGFLPAIVYLIWPGIENPTNCFWAAILYGVGSALDMVDGAIARRFNLVTVFGKFLDPLADKLFYLVTLTALLQLPQARIASWAVMLVLTRELAITALRGMAAAEGIVIDASSGGKLKTTIASLGAIGLLMHYTYMLDFGFGFIFPVNMHRVGLWLTYASIGIAMASGVQYCVAFVREHRHRAAAS